VSFKGNSAHLIQHEEMPGAFIEEYWQMREHLQWAKAGLGCDLDVVLTD
jgi:hypothetical protein